MMGNLTDQAWGKFDRISNCRHHLTHHSADVAAVFEALLALPLLRQVAEHAAGRTLSQADVARLSVWAFLHDIGKLHPAFQAKGWPDASLHGKTRSHLSTAWDWWHAAAEEHALRSTAPQIAAWGQPLEWFRATLAHHGRPVPRHDTSCVTALTERSDYDWRSVDALMEKRIHAWFPAAFEGDAPLPCTPRMVSFYAGLLSLADWIGSDRSVFAYVSRPDPNYMDHARTQARQRLVEIGLDVTHRPLQGPPDFALISDHAAPRPAQAALADADLNAQLVILEAETGSGKTEAALWHFARLRAAGAVDGLYFAVPTRAAAAQLHARIVIAAKRMLGPSAEPVLSIPGQMKAGEVAGKALPHWSVLWDDGDVSGRRWAAEHSTRFLAAEIAVGTVDQAMLAALQVKHAHLRGAVLVRSLLVIDEVHASDAYMGQIQQRLVRDHLALGGHVLLMSATLGSAARSAWLQTQPPDFQAAVKVPYPAVWAEGHAAPFVIDPDGSGKDVRVEVQEDWSPGAVAARALEAAQRGGRVLVIRNTVDVARATWEQVRAPAPELLLSVRGMPALHHSRFAAEDRARLDAAVESALGRQHARSGGCIVIGTQTLEQSLDIDADLLISDLCPMDVLLQRIGRLHRHHRARPADFAQARAIIACPRDLNNLTGRMENGLGAWEKDGAIVGVYPDVPGLAATMEQIVAHPVWKIPLMNRALVEAATHPEALDRIARARGWEGFRDQLRGKTLGEEGIARRGQLNRGDAFPEAYPDEEAIRTRLGEEGLVIDLDSPVMGPFDAPVQRFALPAFWSRGLTGKEEIDVEGRGEGMILRVGKQAFQYGRSGLARAISETTFGK